MPSKSCSTNKIYKADIARNCSMHKVGCRGLCARDVLVDVIVDGSKTTYQFIKPEMVQRIVDEHIIGGAPVQDWAVSEDYHTFHDKQIKVVLSDCGIVDPDEIDSYLSINGYEALQKVISKMSQQDIIDLIKKSGLRGRGGAGFPTGVKSEICKPKKVHPRSILSAMLTKAIQGPSWTGR